MSNSVEQLVYQASLLIDEGELEAAGTTLEEAIQLAEIAGDRKVELVRARILLAELLLHVGEEEKAVALFRDVITSANDPDLDVDDVELELRVAREHVANAAGLE